MTVTRGREHIFLGMEIMFKTDGTVKTRMKEHIKDVISGFNDNIIKSVVTPAACDVFENNDDCLKLKVKDSENFHSTTAKLLQTYIKTLSIRHTASSCIPVYESFMLQQRRLEKAQESSKMSVRNDRRRSDYGGR